MTIEHPKAFWDSLPNWAILDGCFGRSNGIRPSDIDGTVERKGACLFLEAKKTGVAIHAGQLRLWKVLARQTQGNLFVIFWKTGRDAVSHLMTIPPWPPVKRTASLADLREVVTEWYKRADERPI